MIILNKKRLMFITCICVTTFVTHIGLNKKYSKTIETVALPCTNKVVIVDAGHGLPDERGSGS